MEKRKNDPSSAKKRFFRAGDRFFQVNGQWFFAAREGDIGPFRSREQAKREAEAYIKARNMNGGAGPRAVPDRRTNPTVIPGYVYRSVLSMEEQVEPESNPVLSLDDID